jgi:hypothetical protein
MERGAICHVVNKQRGTLLLSTSTAISERPEAIVGFGAAGEDRRFADFGVTKNDDFVGNGPAEIRGDRMHQGKVSVKK